MINKLLIKKILIYTILILVMAFLIFRFFYNSSALREHGRLPEMILFVSQTCPHCFNVRQFIEQNNIQRRIMLSIKEISGVNKDNLYELIDVAHNHCHLKMTAIPVPFLWTKEKCYMGDVTIIRYLKKSLE